MYNLGDYIFKLMQFEDLSIEYNPLGLPQLTGMKEVVNETCNEVFVFFYKISVHDVIAITWLI